MTPILRLEYACSNAELDEARSLSVRKQVGGGSKWRTRVILVFALVGMLLAAWHRFRDIPERDRALRLAAIVGGSVLFVFLKRKFRKTAPVVTRIEISEKDFTILAAESQVVLPWSAFSDCLESQDLFVLLDRSKRTLFVVPKRAFPDVSSQAWFRERATTGRSLVEPVISELSVPVPSTSADRVLLTVHTTFWDCLGRTLASWRTWGFCLLMGGVLLGTFLYSAANPPPREVYSSRQVFVFVVAPLYLFLVVMVVIVSSVSSWLFHAKYPAPQEIALSEKSVAFFGPEGCGDLPWTTFKYYKETPWLLIVWGGSASMILPKREFASPDDLNRCRDLLDRSLKRSRWFVG